MSDDLFSIKNEFYLGNYQGAINEAQSDDLELSAPNDERDRDIIVNPSRVPPQQLRAQRFDRCSGGRRNWRTQQPIPVPRRQRVGGFAGGPAR